MPAIPVLCDKCDRLWLNENIVGVGSGSVAVTFVGSRAGPCPYCGGMGRIPDGVYELTRDVTRLLASLSNQDLATLRALLLQAQSGEIDAEELEARVAREVP